MKSSRFHNPGRPRPAGSLHRMPPLLEHSIMAKKHNSTKRECPYTPRQKCEDKSQNPPLFAQKGLR